MLGAVRDFLLELSATLGKFLGSKNAFLVSVDKPTNLSFGVYGLILELLELGLDDVGIHETSVFSLVLPGVGHELR